MICFSIMSLRHEKNWTQKDLADKLNVTDKAISKWERGLGFPDINQIEPLAFFTGGSLLISYLSNTMIRGRVYKGLLVGGCLLSSLAVVIYIVFGFYFNTAFISMIDVEKISSVTSTE